MKIRFACDFLKGSERPKWRGASDSPVILGKGSERPKWQGASDSPGILRNGSEKTTSASADMDMESVGDRRRIHRKQDVTVVGDLIPSTKASAPPLTEVGGLTPSTKTSAPHHRRDITTRDIIERDAEIIQSTRAASGPDGRQNHRLARGAGCFRVDCEFHCGSNSDEQDYKFPDLKMRWGRGNCRLPNGAVFDVMNDYYCERSYNAVWRHRFPDRKVFKVELGENQDTKNSFLADRDDSIES